jgi:hypothetical protein
MQAIVAAVDRIESNDGSKASKSNNSETSGKLAAGKVAKGGHSHHKQATEEV